MGYAFFGRGSTQGIVGVSGQWSPVAPTDASGVVINGTDAVVDPARPNVIYVGSDGQGIWRSTNYGNPGSWVKVNTGTNGNLIDGGVQQGMAIATNPNNPGGPPVLYVSSDISQIAGLLISTDGGVNWTQTLPANSQVNPTYTNDVYAVAVDPTNANRVVVGFHGQPSLSLTTNALSGSPTWSTITTGSSATQGDSLFPFFINPSPSEISGGASISTTWLTHAQWASNQGIWRTTDSGSTWTKVLAMDHPHGASQIVDVGGGVIYASGYPDGGAGGAAGQGVWKSTDYGVTWTNKYSGAALGSIIATPTNLYAGSGFAGVAAANMVQATRAADTVWSSSTIAGGVTLDTGIKRACWTTDGNKTCVIAGFWSSGIWRYIE